MYYVGIDIAKHTHVATILAENGDVLAKSFKVANSNEGFDMLLQKLHQISDNHADFEVGMESTGHYWLSIYTKLCDNGFNTHVINPVQSDALRGLYIRQVKNDAKDAVIIADILRLGRYNESIVSDDKVFEMRDLTRQRFYLVDMISDLKRKVITLLDRVFPEYASLFSDTFGKTSLELLQTYTTPDEIAQVPTEDLYKILKKTSRSRMKYSKAEEIKQAASNTFGTLLGRDSCSFMLKQFVEQILFLENQLNQLDKEIETRLQAFDTKITTITGIGVVLGASILGEIGDISKFSSPDKLAAFAGIDPRVTQSGQFTGTRQKMSKRGSPYLRRSLWLAAAIAIMHDPAISAFYQRKREQGKHHYTAVGAVCKKLCNIIYAVLTTGKDYQPNI